MKKIIIPSLILVILMSVITFKLYENRKNNIKNVWNVEIVNEYINIREQPTTWSRSLGQVVKDERYKAIEVNLEDEKYVWYKIKKDNVIGWVANPRNGVAYLKDNNDPNDIMPPKIKFYESEVVFKTINDINYDKLDVSDDSGSYKISHKVYKELMENGEYQYWIVYIVVDESGNSASKTQKIVFEVDPDNSKIDDFRK